MKLTAKTVAARCLVLLSEGKRPNATNVFNNYLDAAPSNRGRTIRANKVHKEGVMFIGAHVAPTVEGAHNETCHLLSLPETESEAPQAFAFGASNKRRAQVLLDTCAFSAPWCKAELGGDYGWALCSEGLFWTSGGLGWTTRPEDSPEDRKPSAWATRTADRVARMGTPKLPGVFASDKTVARVQA